MAKGENIFKRKDGRWEARYIKSRDILGKIRYGYCYGKTYREAKEKVSKIKAEQRFGQLQQSSGMESSFGTYCDEWLTIRKPGLKEASWVKYETILRRHIKPKLGSCSLRKITPGVVCEFTDELLQQGLAEKTMKDIITVLRSVLKYAAKQVPGICSSTDIICPRETKKEMRVLSMEEQRRFADYLTTDMDACKFGILLALVTGLRIGELCALRWDNILVQEEYIRVIYTMQRLKNTVETDTNRTRIVISSPKSDHSFRIVPMTEHTAELCRQMKPDWPDAYVLTGTTRFMEPRTLQNHLKRYTAACGLEGVHFHTLRHTFATRCVEVGFEIKTLSEILGHSSTAITLERYVHSSMELKRSNMCKLSSVGW